MVLWAKLLLAGGTGAVVGTGVTAIGAKKYWQKRYEKEKEFLINKNAELKDALNDNESIIAALKEDVGAMTHIIQLEPSNVTDDPEYVDYSHMAKSGKGNDDAKERHTVQVKTPKESYIMSEEDIDIVMEDMDDDCILRGVYYKGSDDYVSDNDCKPITKRTWANDEPWCAIHDDLKKAKVGSILNIMTPAGIVYEVTIEGEKYGSD